MVSTIKRSPTLPKVITKLISETPNIATLSGRTHAQEVVTLRNLRMPENRHINQQTALVFDNDKVKYDIIMGTNFLLN
jgi:hypothetical protein